VQQFFKSRLDAAKSDAQANPTLCKLIVTRWKTSSGPSRA
jgi:hypothetical protein